MFEQLARSELEAMWKGIGRGLIFGTSDTSANEWSC